MILHLNPSEVIISSHVCDFHKKNPYQQYAGCTCTSSWTLKTKSDFMDEESIEKLMKAFDETWRELADK